VIKGSTSPDALIEKLDTITPENGGVAAFYDALTIIRIDVIRERHALLRIKVVQAEIRLHLKDDPKVQDTVRWINRCWEQTKRERSDVRVPVPVTYPPVIAAAASVGGHAFTHTY